MCQHTGTINETQQHQNTHCYGYINQQVKFFTISFQHANHTSTHTHSHIICLKMHMVVHAVFFHVLWNNGRTELYGI